MNYGEHRKQLACLLKQQLEKAGGKGVSVRGGTGTAWGWIHVMGSPRGDHFTKKQSRAVEKVCGPHGLNYWCGEIETVEGILTREGVKFAKYR